MLDKDAINKELDNKELDDEKPSRHLIIEKQNGITQIKKPNRKGNYFEDELLLKAIGCSILDRVRNKNIIFEGYSDYIFFNRFLKITKREDEFKDIGKIYLGGINNIKNILPAIMLTGTEFVVVADNDNESNKRKKELQKNFIEVDWWYEYKITGDNKEITLESFYKKEYIEDKLKSKNDEYNFKDNKTNIENINQAIKDEERSKLKIDLAENFEEKDINKEEYENFLKSIKFNQS